MMQINRPSLVSWHIQQGQGLEYVKRKDGTVIIFPKEHRNRAQRHEAAANKNIEHRKWMQSMKTEKARKQRAKMKKHYKGCR